MSTKHTIDELRQMQALPLDMKIGMTQDRIRAWVQTFGEDGVYVSFSGGKDSTVLLHLVRELYPDIEAVFADTGLEYPEIREFVKTFDNVTIVRPKMSFAEVVKKYGYPIISKNVSARIESYKRNPDKKTARNLQLLGQYKRNDGSRSQFDCVKYLPLAKADFKISDNCCKMIKKSPMKKIKKKKMTAQMASESLQRASQWCKNGCNGFAMSNPTSNPMSFWTEQDVLEYIYTRHIPICSVYGEVVIGDRTGQLGFEGCGYCTTGLERSGCWACLYGCHLEKGETRLQKMKKTHPKLYNFCMSGGGTTLTAFLNLPKRAWVTGT